MSVAAKLIYLGMCGDDETVGRTPNASRPWMAVIYFRLFRSMRLIVTYSYKAVNETLHLYLKNKGIHGSLYRNEDQLA